MLCATCYHQHCDELLSGPVFNLHHCLLWPLSGHNRACSFFVGMTLRYISCLVLCVDVPDWECCVLVHGLILVQSDCIVLLIAWSDCSFQPFTINVSFHWEKKNSAYCIFCDQIRKNVQMCTYNGNFTIFFIQMFFVGMLVWWAASVLSIRSD